MDHRKQAELRKELSQLVGAWARKSGQPHGSVHNELRRRCGGPEVALADPDQLTARVAMVRGLVRRQEVTHGVMSIARLHLAGKPQGPSHHVDSVKRR